MDQVQLAIVAVQVVIHVEDIILALLAIQVITFILQAAIVLALLELMHLVQPVIVVLVDAKTAMEEVQDNAHIALMDISY